MINPQVWRAFIQTLSDHKLTEEERLAQETKRQHVAVRCGLLQLHQWLITWGKEHSDAEQGVGISGGLDVYFEVTENSIEVRELWQDKRQNKGFLRLEWKGTRPWCPTKAGWTWVVSDPWRRDAMKRGFSDPLCWVYSWLCRGEEGS